MYAYALHDLSEAALPVGTAFAGHDQVDAFQTLIEMDQIQDRLDTGTHIAVQEYLQGSAQAAGCAGAFYFIAVNAELVQDHLIIMQHAFLQLLLDLRRSALLLSEGIGGAVLAAQGIGHIAHNGNGCVRKSFVQAADIDPVHMDQVTAEAFQLSAVRVQETDAQGSGASHAAVVGGGAADGNGDIPVALFQSVQNQLAGAVGRGIPGISLLCGYQGQTGSGSHFNDSLIISEDAVLRTDLLHQRSMDRHCDLSAVFCLDDRVDRSLTAVGDRNTGCLAGTENGLRSLCQKGYRLLAAEASLKRI